MNRLRRVGLRLAMLCLVALLLSGCWLRAMFGYTVVETISEEVDAIITAVFANANAVVCTRFEGHYDCTYIFSSDEFPFIPDQTSTFYLISEYGLAGVLIDPLIVQVPADAISVTATYDDGSGPQPLVVTDVASFQATPDITITAEAGQKFLILELPASVTDALPEDGDPANGPQFAMALRFTRLVPSSEPDKTSRVKLMLAVKVMVRGHTYYAPTLPCVTDFADIPALEIPEADEPASLRAAIGDLLGQVSPCSHKVYSYVNVPPPPTAAPTPTATPTPTITPTATEAPTSTETPTIAPRHIWLPLLLR